MKSEAPYDHPVELIEVGRLSDEQNAALVGDEDDPHEPEASLEPTVAAQPST